MKEIPITFTTKGLANLIADKIGREGHENIIQETIHTLIEWGYFNGVAEEPTTHEK